MITCYFRTPDGIGTSLVEVGGAIPPGALWIDIFSPTLEEERLVESQMGVELPSREEIWRNQVLNRFYREKGVYYMTLAMITKINSPYPETSSVTFVKTKACLITMRYIAPTSFMNFAHRLLHAPHKFPDSCEVLEGLLEEIIMRVAHNLEIVVRELDAMSHVIFEQKTQKGANASLMMKEMLARLGTCADLNSKINESLQSINRLLSFSLENPDNNDEVRAGLKVLVTDALALIKQTNFFSDKLTFLLDASLGMINVEQNMIMKVFSVFTVFFLPPTLIASVYGMNFEHMPGLHSPWGYPAALAFMVLCISAPYALFKRKGWL